MPTDEIDTKGYFTYDPAMTIVSDCRGILVRDNITVRFGYA